jgi:hypothetical protein
MAIVMGLSLAIGMVPLQRWWLRVNRALGVPVTKPTQAQWMLGGVMIAALSAAIAIEELVFGKTGSRIAEAAVAICAAIPVGVILLPESYRRMPAVTGSQWYALRISYFYAFILPVVFSVNVILWLVDRHPYHASSALHELSFAMYLAYIALSPFQIVQLRRRYLEAKALKDTRPPDRWQAYKERLAHGE